jgi:hypothetical protein
MRVPLLALFVLLFAATTGLATASLPRPRGAAASANPAPRKAWPEGHKSAKRNVEIEPRIGSWTYAKLHHPELVAQVLRDVAAGKRSRDDVAGLASPGLLDRLVTAKLPERDSARARGAVGAPPKGQTREQARAAGKSEWAQLVGTLQAAPEYSPKQLQLPAAYDKEVKRQSVWFTANADGFVTATLPTGAPFRIARIVAYDGTYTMTAMGPLMNASDSRTSAPFALAVRAGQQFAVTVEFAPEFELGTMMVGMKKGNLRVKDGSFTVNVPISAMFNGIRVAGVVLSPTEDLLVLDTSVPANKAKITTRMQVLNLGDARTATITADTLPTGMTLVGSPSVSLAANEAKTVDVTLQLDGGVYGYGQPLELRATAPGDLTSSTAMTVTVVKSERYWEFDDDIEGVDLSLVYRLDSAGNWNFFATEWNRSSLLPWDIEIQLALGDDYVPNWPYKVSLGTMGGLAGPELANQSDAWDDPGPDGRHTFSKAFFADLVSRPAHFHIQMESRP